MTKHDDNPFRNQLPPRLSKEYLFIDINKRPELQPDSVEENLFEILKVESDFMFGLSRHYYFYERLVGIIYESYRIRTPLWLIKKIVELRTVAKEEIIVAFKDQLRQTQAVFVTYLSGIAGTGKTSIVNFLLRQFPKCIYHPDLGITQIPILKIQTPTRASRKDLCREILRELDDIVNGTFSLNLKRISENEFADYVKQILVAHFVGTIIFDEFQDLRVSKEGPTEQTLSFVKRLTNSLGIPIVFVGSPEMEKVLFGNFQLATRGQGYVWDRLDKKSIEWDKFITALFNQNIFNDRNLTVELRDTYYELTQGIPRVIVKVHVEAQRVALHENATAILVRHLLIAIVTVFKSLTIPMLGISKNLRSILDRYPDLANLEDFSEKEESRQSEESKRKNLHKETKTKDAGMPSIDISNYKSESLFSYVDNCVSEMEVHSVLYENGIILPVSDLIEF